MIVLHNNAFTYKTNNGTLFYVLCKFTARKDELVGHYLPIVFEICSLVKNTKL